MSTRKIGRLINIFLKLINLRVVRADSYVLPRSKVTYANDYLYTYHNADFLKEPKFKAAYELAKKVDDGWLISHTDIEWRIHVLCWAATHAMKLEGDFVDCGVSTGIFARAIIHYTDFSKFKKKYYLIDSFEGMDPRHSSEKEMKLSEILNYKDESRNRYQEVVQNFRSFNVEVHKGFVPDVFEHLNIDKVSFLSIDMNSVYPEVMALNYFWDKMTKGGLIILDDYGFKNECNEQKIAHDDFAKSKGVEVLTLPTCQGLIIKH